MMSVADTDADLIERSARGQPEAFVALVERLEVAVHGFLTRRAGRQAADDLLAEVWLRAFAGRIGYDTGRGDARPWLYGIARNVLRTHWQAGARQSYGATDGTPEDPRDDVIARLDSAAGARTLLPALRELPAPSARCCSSWRANS